MPIKDSRQRNGSLTIDGIEFACQARAVRIDPPEQGDDATEEVLCGDVLASEEGEVWTLVITAIQDFEDPAGLINTSWTKQNTKVPFVWAPQGAAGPSYGGSVTVWPLAVGGDVARRLESEASWRIDGKPTRTEPVP